MKQNTLNLLLNPIVLRLLPHFINHEEITTKEVSNYVSVPQATLYRYINKLEENGIIRVIREEYKRGSYEKVYTLVFNPYQEISKQFKEGTIDDKQTIFTMFMLNITNQFNQYIEKEDTNIEKDETGFHTFSLLLSAEENHSFMQNVLHLARQYELNKPTKEREEYNFSFVHLKG